MMTRRGAGPIAACLLLIWFVGSVGAAPIATFTAEDVIGLSWPRTLITYPLTFEPGKARPDRLKLVSADGTETAHQLSRVKLHPDGSIASARISFMAELPKGGSYRFELLPEPTVPSVATLGIGDERDGLVIRNRVSGLSLLPRGEKKPAEPLRFCSPEEAGAGRMDDAEALLRQGIVPGPVQSVLLNPGRKRTGGSRFVAEKPAEAPQVTSYSCEVLEQGPLFVEARVRYAFHNGGFYQVTFRVLDSDPAIQIDEQFDLKRVGDAYAWQVVYGLSGPGDAGWNPDLAIWKSPQGRLKGRAAERERRFAALGVDLAPSRNNNYGSAALTHDQPQQKVCDLTAWYPWSPSADYVGLVDSAALVPGVDRNTLPFLAVIPLHAGNWRGGHDTFSGSLFTRPEGRVELRWPLVTPPHPTRCCTPANTTPTCPSPSGDGSGRWWAGRRSTTMVSSTITRNRDTSRSTTTRTGRSTGRRMRR